MSIRITIKNPNTTFDKVRIYRDVKAFTVNALPAVLVELTTEESYLDTTSKADTMYWYATSVVYGVDEVVTLLPPTMQHSIIGPGGTELLRGDAECGYYGPVSQTQLFTNVELCGAVNYTPTAISQTWYKFVFQGKIVFFPEVRVSDSVTWSNLYSRGGVYGTDTPGPFTPGTPQNARITKGDFDFRIRLPRMATNPEFAPVSEGSVEHVGSEFVRCFHGLLAYTAASPYPPLGWASISASQVHASAGSSPSISSAMEASTAGTTSMGSVTSSSTVQFRSLATTTAYGWRPVLELIKPPRN